MVSTTSYFVTRSPAVQVPRDAVKISTPGNSAGDWSYRAKSGLLFYSGKYGYNRAFSVLSIDSGFHEPCVLPVCEGQEPGTWYWYG